MDASEKTVLISVILFYIVYSCLTLPCSRVIELCSKISSKEKKANKCSPGSSKTALRKIKTSNLDGEETQPMRPNSVKLSGDSNPEKTQVLSATEKTNKSKRRERASMPIGTKKLSQRPQKEMLYKQSKQKKKFNSTPDQRKSKTRCQRNSRHSHTVIEEIYSSYPNKISKTPGSNTLDNQCKRSVTSARNSYFDLLTGETHRCPKHPLSSSCQCHKESCLVCMTPEYEDCEANYKLSPFSKKMSFSRSFDRIESRDCIIYDKVSSSDEVKIENDNNDDDGNKEITILFNIASEKEILENTQK